MNQVPGQQAPGGASMRRRWWWQRQLWKEETQAALLPPVGTTVGGYHLEAKLGRGGQGTVYRARRGGQWYAVKFIYLPVAGKWSRRELEVLPRLERVGVVRLEGHGKWPDLCPLFLFIAMEYVPGLALYTWASKQRPTARQVARVLLELARQLAAIHAEGVVHRDVKGPNVLVRPEGQPVLVDFGVSTWPSASRVTGPLPPGSWPYRSPEVWRFLRERQPGERYTSSPLDDLWALGIALYRLLTGAYPFDERDEPSQQDAVLTHHPEPPHVRNPRVPRVLGELCLRLLDKAPEARFPTAAALEATLTEILAGADGAWDVPLRDELAPEEPPEEAPTPQPSTLAAPSTSGEPLSVHAPPPTGTRPPRGAFHRWAWGALAVVSLAQGVLVARFLATREPSPPAPASSAPPSASWHLPALEGLEAPGQEVAPPWEWPEGGRSTAPLQAVTPVPVTNATRSQDPRVKTPRAPLASEQPPTAKQSGPAAAKAGTALLACALASGCPGAQVRPLTPDDCPPGAQAAMKKRYMDKRGHAIIKQSNQGRSTVRKGPGAVIMLSSDWGDAPTGTELTGEFFFGEERVYGRFTHARIPGGETFPVCVQLLDVGDGILGVGIYDRPSADTAVIDRGFKVQAVEE
jgi:serine/threonine-protein kinase